MNSSGKVLTIFFIIIAVLLLTLTGASMFFFQQEIDKRKTNELLLAKAEVKVEKLTKEIATVKKETILLSERNKEASKKIESLLSDIEMEKGIKNEIKAENIKLKEQYDKANANQSKVQAILEEKEKIAKNLSQDLKKLRRSVKDIENQLSSEKNKLVKVSSENAALKEKNSELEKQVEEAKSLSANIPNSALVEDLLATDVVSVEEDKDAVNGAGKIAAGVELEPIIIMSEPDIAPITTITKDIPEGRILSVDTDTDFVIVNIGSKDGVENGYVLSVYRGSNYIGDIKVTRVQPEMFAADIIPPMTNKMIRKNDQVVVKK